LKHLEEHVACIRNHFRGLGAKRYQETHGINTPDFVLMYLPIEAAFFVALAHDPGLFSEALDRNVVLTTNSTLLATLRTVASVWKLADQQKHAMEIAKRGGQLYDKFYGFIQDLQKVGDALDRSQDAWDEATKKLYAGPGSLVRQAEMLKTLGAKTSKVLPSQLKAKVEPAEGAEEQVIPTLEPEASDPETSTAPDPSASN
jgi:DNA recombination protein RmuC